MSITHVFYLDNQIARDVIRKPDIRGQLHGLLIPIYGQFYKLYPSYYLFLEYFGLHGKKTLGLQIESLASPFNNIKNDSQIRLNIDKIGEYFDGQAHSNQLGVFDRLQVSIQQQLLEKKEIVMSKINENKQFETDCEIYQELFFAIIYKANNDYQKFSYEISNVLAWKCLTSVEDFNKKLLSEVLLDIWNQLREKEVLFPLAHIAAGFHELPAGIAFKSGLGDMVDSEGITLAVLDGITFLTYDSIESCDERIQIVNQAINKLEHTSQVSIPRKSGQVVCFARPPKPIELLKALETAPIIYL